MKSALIFVLASLFLASCPAPTTSVRLRLQYDESWPLIAFTVSARDKMVRLNATSSDGTKTREIVVSIANDWAGEPILYTVRAYTGTPGREELYASGHTSVTAIEGQTVDDIIGFARSACATWCTPGSTFCRNGGVMVCERSETGCPRWGTPALCSDGQSCSLGECNTQCVNECAEGETRCSGPLGVEICGQSDNDACLDWQQPILCEGAQICSNGRCGDSCMSECTAGSVRCRDGGLSMCADSNSDGCLEWGPSVSCAAGESCAGTEGMPNAAGVAHCQARSTCTDSCTANTCANNTFTTCGNFNLDSCREPSAGTNCTSANPCEEGVCDLSANGGMGGCVTRPRNTPECTGQCAGQAENSSCNDNEACTTGDSCRSGVCTGTRVECTAGREPTCENGVARTYASAGMCMNGTCQYSIASEETCANGCEGTRCVEATVTEMQIAAGAGHTCALLQDGTVRCWGRGVEGQLGNNSPDSRSIPVAVVGLTGVRTIDGGGRHTCALLQDGTARCWGWNSFGQLGNGNTDNQQTPTPVNGLSSSAITAGGEHTCALLQDGTVRCWGRGELGRLGNGTTDHHETPVAVTDLTGALAITAGGIHTCALLQDRTVRCWGRGGEGQLGNSSVGAHSTDFRLTPVAVTGLTDVVAIAAGDFHTCALLQDDSVRCWGSGQHGQLGNGSTNNQRTPVAVTGLTGAIAIAAGRAHTCALLQDGTVRCWGNGQSGQLGNGSTNNQRTPVAVTGLTAAIAIAAGGNHACALLQDGTARSWGGGEFGQLGNGMSGTDYLETTPVAVMGIP